MPAGLVGKRRGRFDEQDAADHGWPAQGGRAQGGSACSGKSELTPVNCSPDHGRAQARVSNSAPDAWTSSAQPGGTSVVVSSWVTSAGPISRSPAPNPA